MERIPKNSPRHVLPRYELKEVFGLRSVVQNENGQYVLEKHLAWINGSVKVIHDYMDSGRINHAKTELETLLKYLHERKHWE
jgi:hypothetical protein